MSTDERAMWQDELTLKGEKAAKLASWFNQICNANLFMIESIESSLVEAKNNEPASATIKFTVSGPAAKMEEFQKVVRAAVAKASKS